MLEFDVGVLGRELPVSFGMLGIAVSLWPHPDAMCVAVIWGLVMLAGDTGLYLYISRKISADRATPRTAAGSRCWPKGIGTSRFGNGRSAVGKCADNLQTESPAAKIG